jgi:hypothetical protein
LSDLAYQIKKSIYNPQKPYIHLYPKSKGINRLTVVFDINEAIVYRFCIEQIEDELLRKARKDGIYGGRKISPSANAQGGDFYEKLFTEWKEFIDSLANSLQTKPFIASTDIASYFECINLLTLKDMVRSDVSSKKGVLNLLFYFLENARMRYEYEVNTYVGLPQEDINCSRILAYYFLNMHDEKMFQFCKENDAEFYRFVDDMNIIVNSEVIGKHALKTLTESLRRLGLTASIEKTSILTADEARKEFFFNENHELNKYEGELFPLLDRGDSTSAIKKKTETYYRHLQRKGKAKLKGWLKILKRFYTIFTYTQSDILLVDIKSHLINYPLVFVGNKIIKYLLCNQNSPKYNKCLLDLMEYLYSKENLYPVLETHILESFLYINENNILEPTKKRIAAMSEDIFFVKNGYQPLSDYSRAIACLLAFRFNPQLIDKMANHYLKAEEQDCMLKKYLIAIALTTENNPIRNKVLEKAKREQNVSITRLINLIDNINNYKDKDSVKKYIANDRIYIYKSKLSERYSPVRAQILSKLIKIYSKTGDL